MKRVSTFIAAMLATTGVFAQTADNFNSRPGVPLSQVKSNLQGKCWQFPDFDINNGNWNPEIDGDGAMVSGKGSSATETTGIYSQLLAMTGSIKVSFKYKLNSEISRRRWLNIYITDGNNNIVSRLDSIELNNSHSNAVNSYNKSFPVGTGNYKVYINYRGIGGSTRIGIDKLSFGAAPSYPGGCNQAPVAVNDNFTGTSDRSAGGNVIPNDYDPQNEPLTAQLISNSPDGTVVLNAAGAFSFTPNPGFTGSGTSFTYKVCNNGFPSLCSNTATVLINFPSQGSLPTSLVDLSATYDNKNVTVKWTTTFEVNNDHFEIERSTDGNSFKTVGSVKGQGRSQVRHDYQFDDEVKGNTAAKNDLYYRLKQVDVDGKISVSKVLVVRVYHSKSIQSVSVTPNPAVNDIKVNVQLNENSYIVMKVTSTNGVELMRKSTRGLVGVNNLTLEGTSRLQAGAYFLEVIINSNERMIVKLIKN